MKCSGWLLFFYSVPSKPVSNRVRVWRRLAKAGAIQFKGAVYVLPYNDEHYEFFQWLVSEVISVKGDASFVKTEKIETMKDSDVVELFNQQRERDYSRLQKGIEELDMKISSIKKGSRIQSSKKLNDQLNVLEREFEAIKTVDFFSSKIGDSTRKNLKSLGSALKGIHGIETGEKIKLVSKSITDYQGKTWVTRRRPFIDRMASAWLIRRFIDRKASFGFIEERDIEGLDKGEVSFDIRGGEFTHGGDMCTFEAIMKSFGLMDNILKKMAEIVHELDIKDEKYKNPEARGIEDILTGLRKTSKNDTELLEKGINVFEMLYVSKTQ